MGFEELTVGDKVEFKGPLGSFEWLGNGLAKWKGVERKASQIGMICGGSGTSLLSSRRLQHWLTLLRDRNHTYHSSAARRYPRRIRLDNATVAPQREQNRGRHPPPLRPRRPLPPRWSVTISTPPLPVERAGRLGAQPREDQRRHDEDAPS